MSVNIIAEIGINHRGCIETARRLIDQAASANCWGVKFQYRHLDSFYGSAQEIGDGIILEELERVDLGIAEFISLAKYAKQNGLKAGVSFFRIRDFEEFGEALEYYDFFKVPSAECTNLPLIDKLLETKKQIMVSTGGHALDLVNKVLGPLRANDLVVFHCIANYPVKLGAQGLRALSAISKMGFDEVGYSSHDEDIEVSLIAMSMGIKWIERHLTEDVKGLGLDDSSSSQIDDFHKLNRFSVAMDLILGSEKKILNQGEILNMQNLGTGLYARKDIIPGCTVSLSDFDIKAPRVGLSVGSFLDGYKNSQVQNHVLAGMPLEERSFKQIKTFNTVELLSGAKNSLVGIPVRLHDFSTFKKLITTGVYEFHLSYQECASGDLVGALKFIDKSDHISIHLPDYIPGNVIMDPISRSDGTKSESRKIITKVTAFAESIRQKIGREVPIVGSFSQTSGRQKNDVLDELFGFLDDNECKNFQILPQWLPVYAWYFGGAVKLDLFNSLEDIEYITKNSRSICLDVCHLSLSAKYANQNWRKWYEMLVPFNKHLHLADAEGVDGEGLPLGEGDIGDFRQFLNADCLKILEVWQGHFNQGEGFLEALDNLFNRSNLNEK